MICIFELNSLSRNGNKAKGGSVFPSPPCPANRVEMGGGEMLRLLPEYSDETGVRLIRIPVRPSHSGQL